MEKKKGMQELLKYKENLLQYGKKLAEENPDHLASDELQALVYRIFKELNKIDTALGHPYTESNIESPNSVSQERIEELYINFINDNNIVVTPNNRIYNYVTQNYSPEKYPKILLCVKEGENSYLGQRFANKGYKVVSVNPLESKVFEERKQKSEDVLEWANLVIGSKLPQCAENFVQMGKPAIFNISNNSKDYNVHFKGLSITSPHGLFREITKCSGVSVRRERYDVFDEDDLLFICNGRERDDGR